MRGEKIYEYDLDVTGVTDYGVTLEAVLSGQERVPPQGVRIDVAFEGHAKGRLAGRVRGIDYLRIRADGRIDLDIHAIVEMEDGHRISLSADGVGVPRAAESGPLLHHAGHRYSRNSFSHSDLLEEETPRLTFPFLSDPDSRQGAL